jgi:hypothetical protein
VDGSTQYFEEHGKAINLADLGAGDTVYITSKRFRSETETPDWELVRAVFLFLGPRLSAPPLPLATLANEVPDRLLPEG